MVQVLPERFCAEQAGANQLADIMLLIWELIFQGGKKKCFQSFPFYIFYNNLVCEYCFEEVNGAILNMTQRDAVMLTFACVFMGKQIKV